jgi:inosine-uridine nucleoside N-ribohydrolase
MISGEACFIAILLACASVAAAQSGRSTAATTRAMHRRIPVILDTDIGDDIDDTWALVMLLKSPQFDVKLITTTNGQQEYRARLIAKLLTTSDRADVPIGLGAGESRGGGAGKQEPWVADFRLTDYRGTVYEDGVQALVDEVHRSRGPPTKKPKRTHPTQAAALKKDPTIAGNANFVGMQGAVFQGYRGSTTPQPEFNVKTDVAAAKAVLSAPWRRAAITPLDTCGLADVSLAGERFQAIQRSDDKLVRAVVENYATWSRKPGTALTTSSTLYDTVAIYLADPDGRSLLRLEPLKIAVTDDGVTTVSPTGTTIDVATRWTSLEQYRDHLVHVLLSPTSAGGG